MGQTTIMSRHKTSYAYGIVAHKCPNVAHLRGICPNDLLSLKIVLTNNQRIDLDTVSHVCLQKENERLY